MDRSHQTRRTCPHLQQFLWRDRHPNNMASINSHTKDDGGVRGEAGKAGTQDVEPARTKRRLPMHANPQHSLTNKDMERHKQEGNKDMEVRAATTRKHTGSSTTIGTCVTHVVLMCHGGTQAKHAHKNAAELDIRKVVKGETTRAKYVSTSRTQCAPQKGRRIHLAYQPGATPSLTIRVGN